METLIHTTFITGLKPWHRGGLEDPGRENDGWVCVPRPHAEGVGHGGRVEGAGGRGGERGELGGSLAWRQHVAPPPALSYPSVYPPVTVNKYRGTTWCATHTRAHTYTHGLVCAYVMQSILFLFMPENSVGW